MGSKKDIGDILTTQIKEINIYPLSSSLRVNSVGLPITCAGKHLLGKLSVLETLAIVERHLNIDGSFGHWPFSPFKLLPTL